MTHPPVRSPPPLFLDILHIVVIANLKTHCLVLKAFRRRRHTGSSVKRQPSILASLLPRALRYVARLTFKLKCYPDQQQGNCFSFGSLSRTLQRYQPHCYLILCMLAVEISTNINLNISKVRWDPHTHTVMKNVCDEK